MHPLITTPPSGNGSAHMGAQHYGDAHAVSQEERGSLAIKPSFGITYERLEQYGQPLSIFPLTD